jgi:hypothetical protein
MLTKQSRIAFLVAGTVLLAASMPARAQGTPPALTPAVPPQIILAPTEIRSDPTLARGCWVRLFPEAAYKGTDDLTIAGPVSIASLHAPTGGASGVYWKPKAESLLVGPRASVALYENESFQGRTVTLSPGTREPQLREKLKFTQSVDSLKVHCSP